MQARLNRLAPAALLLLLACQPRSAAPVYGPWEEGLTLTYENPSLPQPLRTAERLQFRVARASLSPSGPTLVRLTLSNAHGQQNLLFKHEGGGIAMLDDQGNVVAQPLPAGFQNLSRWTDRGIEYRVIGRSTWEGASILPETSDPVGLWIETRTPDGIQRRTLFLPNLGEVESRIYRDGAWVAVNRLVARGFTDLPTSKRS
ncbi:hypothetical protein GETHLI_03230 [Geothrix limicola]|uniref:Lipoprotein n=1 Tax=Geothrix limicola TaxID=2927978 RepID=A0ABQ5QBI2_9BACT|nr:hypothetical protein [Geothrix limicola]GLH71821.1 hypothetical protein GETHLI_03230 [Geothrix limicola]